MSIWIKSSVDGTCCECKPQVCDPCSNCVCIENFNLNIKILQYGPMENEVVSFVKSCTNAPDVFDWNVFPYIWNTGLNVADNLAAIEALPGYGEWFNYRILGDSLLLMTVYAGGCGSVPDCSNCVQMQTPYDECLNDCETGDCINHPALELSSYGVSFEETTVRHGEDCGNGEASCIGYNGGSMYVTGPLYFNGSTLVGCYYSLDVTAA